MQCDNFALPVNAWVVAFGACSARNRKAVFYLPFTETQTRCVFAVE